MTTTLSNQPFAELCIWDCILMSVYIQMTESSFWTTNSLLLLDASLTERNLLFLFQII